MPSLEVHPLRPGFWRPAARLTVAIHKELTTRKLSTIQAQFRVLASDWLEEGEGLVLIEDGRLAGYGWVRDEATQDRRVVHVGLLLAPGARTPDRYRLLTGPLLRAAVRLGRKRQRKEAFAFYRSIDTIHPPIIRAIGFRDLPAKMVGFVHDLEQLPDAPLPDGIVVRPALYPVEAGRIHRLARRCFDEPLSQGQPVHKSFWELHAGELVGDPERLLVAEAKGRGRMGTAPANRRLVGYLASYRDGVPTGSARALETAVAPAWRRRGIASHLISRALANCRRRRLREYFVTELSTSAVCSLVWRLGFRPDAARSFSYFSLPLKDVPRNQCGYRPGGPMG